MIHPAGCGCDSYGCWLRRKGVYFDMKATATSRARRPWRPKVNCSWEAGVAGEHRRDGSFMPYLHANGSKIHLKEMGERRRELTEIRQHQRTAPAKE